VRAVVHAHPPTAAGFAVAGIALDRAVLAEVLTTLGSIPIAEYHPVHGRAAEAVRKDIKAHDGAARQSRALTVGPDVMAAYSRWKRSSISPNQPGGAAARAREPDYARN
jgi:L-fuculose-phosphate aldolase